MATKSDCCGEVESKAPFNTSVKKSLAAPGVKRSLARGRFHMHPDHSIHVKRLNRMIGQLEGVKRMIEERRYCPDILTQTRAAASALKAIELAILETHLRHCVAEAMLSTNVREATSKVEELVKVVGRF